jgi:hypothetical protein
MLNENNVLSDSNALANSLQNTKYFDNDQRYVIFKCIVNQAIHQTL